MCKQLSSKNSDFNIKNIEILKKEFNCEVGLSDHSKDKSIALLSLRWSFNFEKHICIKNSKGLDSKFSIYGKQILDYRKKLIKVLN